MINRLFSIYHSYWNQMDAFWVAASFAVTLLCWGVLKKQGRKHIAASCFTILYLCLVYTSTVLSRTAGTEKHYELVPFWSYSQWFQGNRVFLKYIVLNVLLLLPAGFSLSFVWQDRRKIVLLGFAFSCLIELSQLLTGRGLFEIDDILHNTVGVLLGILIHSAMERIKAAIPSLQKKSEE